MQRDRFFVTVDSAETEALDTRAVINYCRSTLQVYDKHGSPAQGAFLINRDSAQILLRISCPFYPILPHRGLHRTAQQPILPPELPDSEKYPTFVTVGGL